MKHPLNGLSFLARREFSIEEGCVEFKPAELVLDVVPLLPGHDSVAFVQIRLRRGAGIQLGYYCKPVYCLSVPETFKADGQLLPGMHQTRFCFVMILIAEFIDLAR